MTDKALLVGINAYPGCPLNGCINDVTDMAQHLVSQCEFDQGSIRLLVDERATTQGILERLQWLIDGAKAGDRLFFHYSGHGAQVPTRNALGEVDNLDEVICPVDFDWSDSHMIRDKDFHRIFASVPEGVEFIWVSDSCHSGDLSRGFQKSFSKTMPMPADINWRMKTAKALGLTPRGMGTPETPINVALISGCRSNQTSADAFINGRYNGACTYFLIQELNKNSKATLAEVLLGLDASIGAAHYEQVPGVEGSAAIVNTAFLAKPKP